jgi:hypothetical protein
MKVIVSEKTLSKVIGKLVTENYDADKLYHRESLVKRLLVKNQKGFLLRISETSRRQNLKAAQY